MSPKNHHLKLNSNIKVKVLIYSLIVFILAMILGLLLMFQIIDWSWFNGFILGIIVSAFGLILINKSWTVLLTTENHYLYVLLLILRLGLYLVPFLLAFLILDGAVFFYGGILIGFVPLIIFPWVTSSPKISSEKQLVWSV